MLLLNVHRAAAGKMQTCAIVIGGELNGLGVCRSLGLGNITTYLIGRSRVDAAMWSRHARPRRVAMLNGRPLFDCLLSLVAECANFRF